jgi:hypothetical protein
MSGRASSWGGAGAADVGGAGEPAACARAGLGQSKGVKLVKTKRNARTRADQECLAPGIVGRLVPWVLRVL